MQEQKNRREFLKSAAAVGGAAAGAAVVAGRATAASAAASDYALPQTMQAPRLTHVVCMKKIGRGNHFWYGRTCEPNVPILWGSDTSAIETNLVAVKRVPTGFDLRTGRPSDSLLELLLAIEHHTDSRFDNELYVRIEMCDLRVDVGDTITVLLPKEAADRLGLV